MNKPAFIILATSGRGKNLERKSYRRLKLALRLNGIPDSKYFEIYEAIRNKGKWERSKPFIQLVRVEYITLKHERRNA